MKQITVSGEVFSVKLVREDEGYIYRICEYDLLYNNLVIAKDLSSIKSCYVKALEFLENRSNR